MAAKGEDLSVQYDGYAVYLPSLQRGYARYPLRDASKHEAETLTRGFEPSDLNFLSDQCKLWHCKYVLYSAGQFDRSVISTPDIVSTRSKDTVVIGDSGGYQIGTGKFPLVEGWHKHSKDPNLIFNKWMREKSIRDMVLRWLDRYCDYAMTLDMPLWILNEKKSAKSPFAKLSAQQLIALSVENLRYFADKRGAATGAKAKYLNVLQDAGDGTGEAWYQAVKDFDFEGWAFGGDTKSGIQPILHWVRRLLDDGKLDKAEWLHILMASPAENSVYLTAIQRRLRALLGTDITVSYDSSSPFQSAGIGQNIAQRPALTSDIGTWAIKFSPFPQGPSYLNADEPTYLTDFPSPVTRRFSVDDLHSDRGAFAQTYLSEAAVHLLTNHNIYVYHQAAIAACDIVFGETTRDEARIPKEIAEQVEAIEKFLS
jgi:hypothetical protein